MIPVLVIGLGLGPDDLSPRLRELVDQAQVLAGGRRLLAYFPEHPGRRIELTGGLEPWLDQVQAAAQSMPVAVLASGDPGFHGVATALVRRLGREMVRIQPNVTAMQGACARLGLPWGAAVHVSLHAADAEALPRLWTALGQSDLVVVYPGPTLGPARLAVMLAERGQDCWRVSVLENLGAADERLSSFARASEVAGVFGPLCVVALERVAPRPPALTIGAPEAAYQSDGGLITKAEVRAVALAKLALGPKLTLWDVGAGSGSVGLEAASLMPGGTVWAVERDPRRVAMIRANRARYGLAMLEAIEGQAPEALADLPRPDRVFIGGGGPNLEAIIAVCAARLAPGGLIVVSAVLGGSIETARRALARAGLGVDETFVQICRGQAVAGQTMLKALNPVWLLRGRADGEQ